MKYKVGDRVKIKSWEQMEREYGTLPSGGINCSKFFNELMKKYCEKEMTIGMVDFDFEYYGMIEDAGHFSWSDDMIAGYAGGENGMKYKSGNKVKIKSWEKLVKEYGFDDEDSEDINCDKLFIKFMREYCEKVMTIKKVNTDSYTMVEDDGEYMWTDDMIECVVDRNVCAETGTEYVGTLSPEHIKKLMDSVKLTPIIGETDCTDIALLDAYRTVLIDLIKVVVR